MIKKMHFVHYDSEEHRGEVFRIFMCEDKEQAAILFEQVCDTPIKFITTPEERKA
jgi:hypothetical protein